MPTDSMKCCFASAISPATRSSREAPIRRLPTTGSPPWSASVAFSTCASGTTRASSRRRTRAGTATRSGSRCAVAWHGIEAPERGTAALLDAIQKLQGAFVPASDLETRILPARVAKYDPRDLDALLGSGQVMWMGGGALGPRDGKIALFLAEHFTLLRPEPRDRPDRPIHDRLREVLAARGASFFPQLLAAARGGFAPELGDALWDLVWAGEVTNDTFHAVRALLTPRRRSRGAARSAGRAAHLRSLDRFALRDDVAGRWSLTSAAGDAPVTTTERATAQIRQILERHGVVTRETVRAEGLDGGFASAYGILKAMEDAGRVRRGY